MGNVLNLIGALGVFLFGMKIMSSALQKIAGSKLQSILNYMTGNRVFAVMTGIIVTALVQSSSATTVMVVSFVNANLLNLVQSIGVIMGANIGTTVTTWIVSFLGFKFKIVSIALPIIGIGLPFMFAKNQKQKDIGELLMGFGLLFIGLSFLKDAVPDIKSSPEVMSFLANYADLGFLSFLIFVVVGTLLTVTVQSSSAAMAITVTMVYKGWIPLPMAAAMVLGENIGTTITANLAAIGTNVNARRAARAHFLFNVFGVVWVALFFNQFLNFILNITPWDSTVISNYPLNISLFHTVFNIFNAIISIFFVKQLAILSTKMVKESPKESSSEYQLQYLSTNLQGSSELELVAAKNEVKNMLLLADEMYKEFTSIYFENPKDIGEILKSSKEKEELSDDMQVGIIKFLNRCYNENLSKESLNNVTTMIRIVNEIENICDACYQLVYLVNRKRESGYQFHVDAKNELKSFANLVREFLDFLIEHLDASIEKLGEDDLDTAFIFENKINASRDKFKKAARDRMEKKLEMDIKGEFIYLDILRIFEHIGDNSLNIAQALKKIKN